MGITMANRKEYSNVVLKRLKEDMKERAKIIAGMEKEVRLWAEQGKYVRICGASFRPISAEPRFPLVGYGRNSVKKIDRVNARFDLYKEKLKEVDGVKAERRLQSYIIREAMKNGRDLTRVLNISNTFDELLFCLDEISLGDRNNKVQLEFDNETGIVRCDILAVGKLKNSSDWRPVLLELKYDRSMKRLNAQLKNFTSLFDTEEMRDALEDLIKTLIPKKIDKYDGTFIKGIVWPAPNNPEKITPLYSGLDDLIELVYNKPSTKEEAVRNDNWHIRLFDRSVKNDS